MAGSYGLSNAIKLPIISVVDNDASILDALKLTLEDLGYEAKCFSSGKRFLEYAAKNHIDLVILDPHLPGINGVDVFVKMETSIPTVILTAWPTAPLTLELVELGAIELMTKPVSLDTLQRVLELHVPS